jgi:N-acetylglutamate synthase-like GNAT family acetyltransferase
MLIRQGKAADFSHILALINEAAQVYRGIIPNDRWHEPYMAAEELSREIADGVAFWVVEDDGGVLGVMGVQDRDDVTLVRHAYVSPSQQRKGVGVTLLRHIETLSTKPILIGTWADASWAIAFYLRNGYTLIPSSETGSLLRTYWSIPERQIETSVVLANRQWTERSRGISTDTGRP